MKRMSDRITWQGLRLFALLIAIVLSAQAAAQAPAERITLTEEEQQWIAQHSPVRVGFIPEWAPFSYRGPQGEIRGIDAEVLDIIARRTGLRFQKVATESWAHTVKLVEAGEIMVTTSTAESVERRERFDFTRPYYNSAIVIVAREGDLRFAHLGRLRNAVIAMPRRHQTTLALRDQMPQAKIVYAENQSECFEMVRNESADAAIANIFVATSYLDHHPNSGLAISGVILEMSFPLRLAVRKDSGPLVSILDRALNSISRELLDEITARHMDLNLQASARLELFKERALSATLIVAAAGLLLLWRFASLRKEVRQRREAEHQLREINRSLEVFAHAISHDLKTPLRAIHGLIQVLGEDCGPLLDARGKDYLARINTSSQRMDRMLNGLLDYSKTSCSHVTATTVSLSRLLPELVAEMPEEQQRFIHLEGEFPAVQANPSLLGRSISNLLYNALKYVPRERTPDVRVSATRSGHRVILSVKDNGYGIAPENQRKVFDLFQRVPSPSRTEVEGTGIGLAVVAKAMERMGGRFGVESEPGQGSRFWLELPVQGAMAHGAEPDHSTTRSRLFHFGRAMGNIGHR